MRAFISIDLPKEAKEKVKEIQDKLPEFSGKKTEIENLHLTLKFLGEVDEEVIEKVKERLREIKFNSFETEIDSIGIFSEKFIRIVWLHLSNCDNLQKEIDNNLADLFAKENRFMSHMTIARIKNIKDKKSFLEEIRKIKFEKISFEVDRFLLKKSTLTESGPIYEVIEEYKLE